MSAIDLYKPKLLGYFTGIPVYLPTKVIRDSGVVHGVGVSKDCHVLIGGGSGEHPALVVDYRAALVHFMDDFATDTGNDALIELMDTSFCTAFLCARLDQNQWPLSAYFHAAKAFGLDPSDADLNSKLYSKFGQMLAVFEPALGLQVEKLNEMMRVLREGLLDHPKYATELYSLYETAQRVKN